MSAISFHSGENTVCDRLTWYIVVMYTVSHVQAMLRNLKDCSIGYRESTEATHLRTTGNVDGGVVYGVVGMCVTPMCCSMSSKTTLDVLSLGPFSCQMNDHAPFPVPFEESYREPVAERIFSRCANLWMQGVEVRIRPNGKCDELTSAKFGILVYIYLQTRSISPSCVTLASTFFRRLSISCSPQATS